MKKRFISLFITISILLSLFSINSIVFSETPGDNSRIVPITPIYIWISELSASIKRGEGMLLTATIDNEADPNATVGWTSSDETVATVSDDGYVIGCSAGTATITAIYSSELGLLGVTTARCEVTVSSDLILENGTYFLKNKQTGRYADIKGPTMASGTTIHQWQFHGGNSQKWVFNYLGDGYYSIKSNNSSSPYYLGVKNDSTGLDVDIVLRTGTITDGMKWRIELTQNGAYKIIPKTGEASGYVLATSTSNTTNGAKLIQGDYIDNNSYRDEWLLHQQKDYTLMYLGYSLGDPLMPPIESSVRAALQNNAGMNGYGYTYLSKSTALVRLSSTSIFSCITHGYQTSIEVSDGEITITDINALDASAFDNLKFVYLGACETGKGKSAQNNLVNTIYSKGADAVLGFTVNVLVIETNMWTTEFMLALSEGATLRAAIAAADAYVYDNWEYDIDLLTITADTRYLLGSDQLVPCP